MNTSRSRFETTSSSASCTGLSRSELRERFVLKGAMLLRLWADQPYRATVDLDLISRGNPDPDSVARDIAAICRTDVPDDAVVFAASTISVEPIRAQEEYSGVRAMFDARLGTIRERLQVDIGFGDALWPHAEEMAYPVALGDPSPLIRVYSPETVIAEKLEAIVSLGIRNSRIKDFFDIDYLARSGRFDRAVLLEAVCRTFTRRGTPIALLCFADFSGRISVLTQLAVGGTPLPPLPPPHAARAANGIPGNPSGNYIGIKTDRYRNDVIAGSFLKRSQMVQKLTKDA